MLALLVLFTVSLSLLLEWALQRAGRLDAFALDR